MKNRKLLITVAVAAVLTVWFVPSGPAANIAVTNAALNYRDTAAGQRFVQFDVQWDASWRAAWTYTNNTPTVVTNSVTNWDAAWIFVKYRLAGSTSEWSHATLSTNSSDHQSPAGSTISVGLSTNAGGTNFGVGVFLYHSAEASGSWTNRGVKLRWQYGVDGVGRESRVDVCVHAIEMVYVPQGSFYLGDGNISSDSGTNFACQFEDGQFTNAFLVTNDNYIIYLGGGTNGNLGNNNNEGVAGTTTDDFNNVIGQILPAPFPKGYSAFYCMKYEISQGQYKDFLNSLSRAQQVNRVASTNASYFAMAGCSTTNHHIFSANVRGNGICTPSNVPPSAPITFGCDFNTNGVFDEANDGQTLACNWLSWADEAAYADWAGLRPMTELEFEKACRGPMSPVINECAWGAPNITPNSTANVIKTVVGVFGGGTEATSSPTNFQCLGSIAGPVRCGIFATASSGRIDAGASYWGIMEMSGNLYESVVTVGRPDGRVFTGTHGDGRLTSVGTADVPSWPGSAVGLGFRGGTYNGYPRHMSVSDRYWASAGFGRGISAGMRAVRLDPGVNP